VLGATHVDHRTSRSVGLRVKVASSLLLSPAFRQTQVGCRPTVRNHWPACVFLYHKLTYCTLGRCKMYVMGSQVKVVPRLLQVPQAHPRGARSRCWWPPWTAAWWPCTRGVGLRSTQSWGGWCGRSTLTQSSCVPSLWAGELRKSSCTAEQHCKVCVAVPIASNLVAGAQLLHLLVDQHSSLNLCLLQQHLCVNPSLLCPGYVSASSCSALWVGCGDGHIAALDSVGGGLIARWPAHLFPVRSLAAVGGLIFSLSSEGAIRGWPAVQPPPPQYLSAWKVCASDTSYRSVGTSNTVSIPEERIAGQSTWSKGRKYDPKTTWLCSLKVSTSAMQPAGWCPGGYAPQCPACAGGHLERGHRAPHPRLHPGVAGGEVTGRRHRVHWAAGGVHSN
jgi:hypothetical protein